MDPHIKNEKKSFPTVRGSFQGWLRLWKAMLENVAPGMNLLNILQQDLGRSP